MGLHWGAPVLKSLMPDAWWDGIQSLQVDPSVPTKDHDTLKWLRGDTGELIAAMTFGPFYRLRRSKLRDVLAHRVDVHYDKRLHAVSYAPDGLSVTAHFADGTTATGSMLVGADGARSATREMLLGRELGAISHIPYAATFVHSTFSKHQALYLRSFHPLYLASAHPNNLFAFFGLQHAPDADDPSSWTFFYYISWRCTLEEHEAAKSWSDAQLLAQQKEFAKDFCDPWKSAYEWTPEDASVWNLGLTEWDPGLDGHRWDNHRGRVTLVGDACHPMTYQRGQGLNHSVTDAANLCEAIKRMAAGDDRQATMTAFEDEMIKRGGAEVRDCTANTAMLHDWERVRQSPLFTKGMSKTQNEA